jgi:hypothetical protein
MKHENCFVQTLSATRQRVIPLRKGEIDTLNTLHNWGLTVGRLRELRSLCTIGFVLLGCGLTFVYAECVIVSLGCVLATFEYSLKCKYTTYLEKAIQKNIEYSFFEEITNGDQETRPTESGQ